MKRGKVFRICIFDKIGKIVMITGKNRRRFKDMAIFTNTFSKTVKKITGFSKSIWGFCCFTKTMKVRYKNEMGINT